LYAHRPPALSLREVVRNHDGEFAAPLSSSNEREVVYGLRPK
jgi:hypothetical protein